MTIYVMEELWIVAISINNQKTVTNQGRPLFGAPTLIEFRVAGRDGAQTRNVRRAFAGQGDGVMTLAVLQAPQNNQLLFVMQRGMRRPNIEPIFKPEVLPPGVTVLDRSHYGPGLSGIEIEGAAGRIERGEAVAAAMQREALEEIGITEADQTAFFIGQPTYPDPSHYLEKHCYGILAVRRKDVGGLRPAGEGSANEQGLVPFATNLSGLIRIQKESHMPIHHFLLPALRLWAALSGQINIDWHREESINLPRTNNLGVNFKELLIDERLETDGGDGLAVRYFRHALAYQRGEEGMSPFPAMLSFPLGGVNSLGLFVTFIDGQGVRQTIIPDPEEQLVFYARGLNSERLVAKGLVLDGVRETSNFATGINCRLTAEEIGELNEGRVTLEAVAQERVEALIGRSAASTAKISRQLGPSFATPGISAETVFPVTVEVDASRINLATGYQAIPLEEAFGKIRNGQLVDMAWETIALHYLFSRGLRAPEYLFFDRKGFLGQI
ncbi:MAG: NUDIX domain-containing protein [Candidatus Margulisbacteria bacterium]|nr:NUDIX domain-containing protein [Candidatus Margulisiibacteriota bacterium]